MELFQWEAIPNNSKDLSDHTASGVIAAPKGQTWTPHISFTDENAALSEGSGGSAPATSTPTIDPVSMLLWSMGLVGLAGFVRKKIRQ